jgi:excisionase family DNA binding protein
MTAELLTVQEAGRILGMSTQNVRYYEGLGRLHAIRVGTHRIFFRQDVERFKHERDTETKAKAVPIGISG